MIDLLFIMAALFIGAAFGYHKGRMRERRKWQPIARQVELLRSNVCGAVREMRGAEDKDEQA